MKKIVKNNGEIIMFSETSEEFDDESIFLEEGGQEESMPIFEATKKTLNETKSEPKNIFLTLSVIDSNKKKHKILEEFTGRLSSYKETACIASDEYSKQYIMKFWSDVEQSIIYCDKIAGLINTNKFLTFKKRLILGKNFSEKILVGKITSHKLYNIKNDMALHKVVLSFM